MQLLFIQIKKNVQTFICIKKELSQNWRNYWEQNRERIRRRNKFVIIFIKDINKLDDINKFGNNIDINKLDDINNDINKVGNNEDNNITDFKDINKFDDINKS